MVDNNGSQHILTSELRISPYDLEALLEVEITQKLNEHGTLYIKGVLPEGVSIDAAMLQVDGTNVKLSAVNSGDELVLFQGVAESVEVRTEGDVRNIEVRAKTHSVTMDQTRKSRSFQDKDRKYIELFHQVANSYAGGDVLDKITEDKLVNMFIMQHEETDWDFLKRLASHFQTGLVCAVRHDEPKLYLGIPNLERHEMSDHNFSITRDMERYWSLSKNGVKNLSATDFTRYNLRTDRIISIGDQVVLDGIELYVYAITSVASNELLENHLTLYPENGMCQPHLVNNRIAGTSYSGHIINVRNDQVQVALDTDAGHDPGDPCWFKYSTVYSSQDGSGWYCMPEQGDTARLHFPNSDENRAYVISSVHEQVDQSLLEETNERGGVGGGMRAPTAPGGGYSGQRDDPEVKSLRNKDGKEIRLTPEGIYLIVDGTIITLTEEGLLVMTDNDIELKSEKSIILSAEDEVNIIGNVSVDMVCTDTTAITLSDDVHMVGHEVLAN